MFTTSASGQQQQQVFYTTSPPQYESQTQLSYFPPKYSNVFGTFQPKSAPSYVLTCDLYPPITAIVDSEQPMNNGETADRHDNNDDTGTSSVVFQLGREHWSSATLHTIVDVDNNSQSSTAHDTSDHLSLSNTIEQASNVPVPSEKGVDSAAMLLSALPHSNNISYHLSSPDNGSDCDIIYVF